MDTVARHVPREISTRPPAARTPPFWQALGWARSPSAVLAALRRRWGDYSTVATSTLKTLADLSASDADAVGGKAANCARLRRAGFPVPDGLVVPADADDASIARLLVHPWFATQPEGQTFAVRSSGIGEDGAGHSFAGIHDTLLNVRRAGIADAVHTCRRSTTSDQARAYRASRGLRGEARTGVLIQPMVAAVVSGVAFTIHPVTGADELLINAAPGLGDALVSGQIEPDEFRVSKRDVSILSSRRAAGRANDAVGLLEPAQIRHLSDCLLRIEQHYGSPQDVEWCWDSEHLWIVQSRPITTRPAAQPDIEWTRANTAEVLPEQISPQAAHFYEEVFNAAQRPHMGRLLGPEAELGPLVKAFAGRLYNNLTQLRHLARICGVPPAGLLRSVGHPVAIEPADEVTSRPPFRAFLPLIPDFVRLALLDARAPSLVRKQNAQNAADIASLLSVDPRRLDDRALWDRLEQWRQTFPDRLQVVLVLAGVFHLDDMLRRAARAAGTSYEALVYPQLAAGEPSVSTRQAFDLVALADIARNEPASVTYLAHAAEFTDFRQRLAGSAFLQAFERFLERYGHRGHYETDWALPRYREDPTPLLFAIGTHVRHAPADNQDTITRRLKDEAARTWAAFDDHLSRWQKLTLKPRVRALIRRLKQRYVMREHCRSELMRVQFHVRQWHLALADRFVERGRLDTRDDYFLLLMPEIAAVIHGHADSASLRGIASARQRERAVQAAMYLPLLMRQSEVDAVLAGTLASGQHNETAAVGERLDGLCVSRGVVEADVVVIRDPRDFALMRKNAILVAPATDPSWTPLFTLASGVIVEIGGILSHASTVAREYGLPALANVKHATRRLKTGDRVRLDASAGHADRL